jgi:hypothetical protein
MTLFGCMSELGDTEQALDGNARDRFLSLNTDGNAWTRVQAGPSSPTFNGFEALGNPAPGLVKIATERNQDGRLNVFAIGRDGVLYGRYQVTAGGGWNPEGWQSMGGAWITQVTTARNADGRIELFVLNQLGNVFHRYQVTPNGGWNTDGWGPMGGTEVTMITAAKRDDGRIEIVALGGDGRAYRRAQFAPNNGWDSGWSTAFGAQLTSLKLVEFNGRMHLLALDSAKNVEEATEGADEAWTAFSLIARGPVEQISVGRTNDANDSRLEVFGIDSNRNAYELTMAPVTYVWNSYFNWIGWQNVAQIASANEANGDQLAFVRKADGTMWAADQSLTPGSSLWNPLQSLGGAYQTDLVAIDQQ